MKRTNNPFRPTVHASELRSGQSRSSGLTTFSSPLGGSEPLVARNGEINAGSKRELMGRMVQMANLTNAGTVIQPDSAAADQARQQRIATLANVMNDRTAHVAVGSAMGDEIHVTNQRQGFTRNILAAMEVSNGVVPQIKVRAHNVTAAMATGPTSVETQIVRDKYIYPVEYNIVARPYIEQQEMVKNSNDLLEEKYLETLQAFMVQEDRMFIRLCQAVSGVDNSFVNQIGAMNPTALGQMRNQVTRWGLDSATWLIANDLLTDMISHPDFLSLWEPMAQHELILTGKLGVLLGMNIKTDAYRHPEHRVLDAGDMYIFSSPDTLGSYTDRNGIETLPIDAAITGIPGRGWNMTSMISQTIANSRGVVSGRRIA